MTGQVYNGLPQQMEKYLAEHLPRYLDILKQMVEINSFTLNTEGVNKLGTLTATLFEQLGFTAERVPAGHWQYADHVVLTRPGKSGRKIGMISHLDTVYSEMEELDNDFSWREVGDRIYGPGTIDIKGGTVMIYMVLEALQHCAPQVLDDITWLVMLDACEETDITLFGEMSKQFLNGDTLACLVFEASHGKTPAESSVVVCRKGMAIFRIEAEGRGAHPGTAFGQGVNAIVHLANTVQKMAAITDESRGLTVNVGTIAGGTTINRVPHFASAGAELRAFNSDIFGHALEQIMSLAGPVQTTGEVDPGHVQIEVLRQVAPWSRNKNSNRLLKIWQSVGQSLGRQVMAEERGGLSDGNMVWQRFPTIDGLGPLGGNAHCSERSKDGQKDQEYVLRSSFVPLARLNALSILELVKDT